MTCIYIHRCDNRGGQGGLELPSHNFCLQATKSSKYSNKTVIYYNWIDLIFLWGHAPSALEELCFAYLLHFGANPLFTMPMFASIKLHNWDKFKRTYYRDMSKFVIADVLANQISIVNFYWGLWQSNVILFYCMITSLLRVHIYLTRKVELILSLRSSSSRSQVRESIKHSSISVTLGPDICIWLWLLQRKKLH